MGVLLYLTRAERHAEIVADVGVLALIPAEAWDGILRDLLAALAAADAGGGLTRAVERVGARLAAAFPAGPDDSAELPNRVIVTDQRGPPGRRGPRQGGTGTGSCGSP